MRLNLGCGDHYAPDWVNVDLASPYHKDVTADLREPLPFDDDSASQVYLGHVLEHLTQEDCLALMREVTRVARTDAPVVVVGPDCERAVKMHFTDGTVDSQLLHEIRKGGGRWKGDEHLWECNPGEIQRILNDAGLRDIQEIPIDRVETTWPVVSRVGWQCAVWSHV